MNYYFSKTIEGSFDDVIAKTSQALKQEGFGILTDIDVQKTLQEKIGASFRKYRILGACNAPFAHKALMAEGKIGTMLPCNVIVQEIEDGKIEIAAIDPVASMQAVDNAALHDIAGQVRLKLKNVVEDL